MSRTPPASRADAIPEPDIGAGERARAAIDRKTKPPGSLGRLESLAVSLARLQATDQPEADPARLYLCAGDHGITAAGVSAWPQEVTGQMVANFLAGGAAANALAGAAGCQIQVVDAGIAPADRPTPPALLRAAIRPGTRNALVEDALTPAEVEKALAFGHRLARSAADSGIRTILLGEMGIGNSSSAALVAAAVTGLPVAELTGAGAGLDAAGLAHKTRVLERAAARRPGRLAGADALAAFGGLEAAVLAGLALGAARARQTVLVDGFIASSAVLAAIADHPALREFCIFAHVSAERGHRRLLDWLDAEPLLDLGLRLGEGTGALLALPLLRAACAMRREMAEFGEAGVAGQRPEA